MATKLWAMGLVLLTTILTSSAQIIYKLGVKPFNIYLILLGLAVYGVSAVILLKALKAGELSVLYPIFATSYIWVSLFSPIFFPSDVMNAIKWAGVVFIVAGVSFIGIGGKDGSKHAEVV